MGRRRAAPKTKNTQRGRKPQKTDHGLKRKWLAPALGILLVVSAIAGVLIFRGGSAAHLAVLRTADYHSLAFSPDDPDVVFFGHHDGIMRSDDGGRTWRGLIERQNFDAMALASGPNDSRLIYLAGHDIFQVSRDGGVTWREVLHDLPGTDIHGFAMSPEDPERLFAFVVGHGFFRSNDGGLTWVKLSDQLPRDVVGVAVSVGSPETLYLATIGSGVLRSADGGQTWSASSSGLGLGAVTAVATDPGAPRTVYAGGTIGLYRSTDGGDSWTELDFPGRNLAALATNPARPGVLLAINVVGNEGRVYRSEDGGLTWGK